jgi:hypothetical protein
LLVIRRPRPPDSRNPLSTMTHILSTGPSENDQENERDSHLQLIRPPRKRKSFREQVPETA